MKLLFLIHQYFPEHLGGTEVYLREIAAWMNKEGHTIHIVTCIEAPEITSGDVIVRNLFVDTIPVTQLCFNLGAMPLPARAEYDNPACGEAVRQVISRFRPEIAHCFHPMKISGSAITACVDAGLPVVVTLSDFWIICPNGTLLRPDDSRCQGPKHRLACLKCTHQLHGFPHLSISIKKIWRCLREIKAIAGRNRHLHRTLLQADAIVALSHFQKKILMANGFPAHRILVDRHGICPRQLQGFIHSRREEKLRVGIVASPVRHKGVHLLLEALSLIPDARIELLLYLGQTLPSSPFAAQIAQRATNDSRIRMMGGFEPDDFGRILSGFDVLAVPSIWFENEPLIIKAALYCGIPVMATDVPPLNSLVKAGMNGWLVAPDPAAWAEALTAMSLCDQLPDATGSWTLDMDANARYYENLYKDIM